LYCLFPWRRTTCTACNNLDNGLDRRFLDILLLTICNWSCQLVFRYYYLFTRTELWHSKGRGESHRAIWRNDSRTKKKINIWGNGRELFFGIVRSMHYVCCIIIIIIFVWHCLALFDLDLLPMFCVPPSNPLVSCSLYLFLWMNVASFLFSSLSYFLLFSTASVLWSWNN